MRRKRVVRTADGLSNHPGWQAIGLTPHEKPENLKPARLPERSQSGERVRD